MAAAKSSDITKAITVRSWCCVSVVGGLVGLFSWFGGRGGGGVGCGFGSVFGLLCGDLRQKQVFGRANTLSIIPSLDDLIVAQSKPIRSYRGKKQAPASVSRQSTLTLTLTTLQMMTH